MPWEQRGDRRYYYRTERRLGRAARRYVGSGDVAELAAAADELHRLERAAAYLWVLRLSSRLGSWQRCLAVCGTMSCLRILVQAEALTRSRHALFLRGKERVQKHEVVH